MSPTLARIRSACKPFLDIIFPIFQEERIVIRAVGGCVRDAILGLPINDVDFCTSALPEELYKLKILNV